MLALGPRSQLLAAERIARNLQAMPIATAPETLHCHSPGGHGRVADLPRHDQLQRLFERLRQIGMLASGPRGLLRL